MKARSVVRDCLYLNWALPVERLPAPPESLRYETHDHLGEPHAFLSALLFRQQSVRLASLPLPRVSYCQCNLRLYVLDGDGVPSVLFLRTLVPAWVVPAALWIARQPVQPGLFQFPRRGILEAGGRWSVSGDGRLAVEAVAGGERLGTGPDLGSWECSIGYFRRRTRGYADGHRGLRRIELSASRSAVHPMVAELTTTSLLERCVPRTPWPELHSAFLCPEIPLQFELAFAPRIPSLARIGPKVAADPAMLRQARRSQGRQGSAA